MSTWQSCPAVERDPEKVSGAWVFSGTRVPVATLFENLGTAPVSTSSWIGSPEWNACRSKAFSITRPGI